MIDRRIRPRWRSGLVMLALWVLAAGARSGQSATSSWTPDPESNAASELAVRLDRMLASPHARSAFWGVYVVDVGSGAVLYDHYGDKRFMPASNLKLFTTTTALEVLGGQHRWQTILFFNGAVRGDTLVGDVIVRGSGDPSFGSTRYRTDPLQEWARELSRAGVRAVRGRIIGDDDAFEDAPYADGWDVGLIATRAYAPSSSGLSYRDNLIDIIVRGRPNGASPLVTQSPVPHFEVENAATSRSGRGAALEVHRLPGSTSLRLTGTIGSGETRRMRLPVGNPTLYAVSSLARYLRASGIQVDAEVFDGDDLPGGVNYRGAMPLLAHVSPPLDRMIHLINKNSNNFYAEQVFRSLAPSGTTSAAESRVKQLLRKAGVATDALSIRDGSGLSRKDLVTPKSLVQLLAYMVKHPEWDAFTQSLPRGGERGTTLARRLSDVTVQAKTGSIEYARALTGYVVTRDNRLLAFSIIANNYAVSGGSISGTLDGIVRTLAAYRADV